jgi:hypothetical protein
MLDAKHESSCHAEHEPAPIGNPCSYPQPLGRGCVRTDKLVDMADVARLIDDAEMRATDQRRVAVLGLPQSN